MFLQRFLSRQELLLESRGHLLIDALEIELHVLSETGRSRGDSNNDRDHPQAAAAGAEQPAQPSSVVPNPPSGVLRSQSLKAGQVPPARSKRHFEPRSTVFSLP